MSSVLTPVDPDARRRLRREQRRRQVRRRRITALALVLAFVAGGIASAVVLTRSGATRAPVQRAEPARVVRRAVPAKPAIPAHVAVPWEIRGVHVTMALASIPGKLAEYASLQRDGLNTIELDVKDENGDVAFFHAAPPLAREVGAAKRYYDPRKAVRLLHSHRLYVIGRVVSFEDPIASVRHPQMAIRRSDGSLWQTNGGLGWLNPYSHEAWRYDVDVAAAAARAGFDEIQFDYVRFPSDGDLSIIRYPGAHPQPMAQTIPAFLRYAVKRLKPLGVRVSADVFGLSATRDLGIGQHPRDVGRVVDAIYPMVYPSHYNRGEYNLDDPNAVPGATVSHSLADFRRQLRGGHAEIVPWLQDFSLGRTYSLDDVRQQIAAARRYRTGGFMLWNAEGVYTAEALAAGPPPPLPPLPPPGL